VIVPSLLNAVLPIDFNSIRVAGVFVSKRLEVFHDPTSSDLSSDSGYVRRAQEVRQSNATKTASEQAFMAWPNS
jgi:hypothetical protein